MFPQPRYAQIDLRVLWGHGHVLSESLPVSSIIFALERHLCPRDILATLLEFQKNHGFENPLPLLCR